MQPPVPRRGKCVALADPLRTTLAASRRVALAPLFRARWAPWVLLLVASAARADEPVVYRWTDENGVAHYTTQEGRIPSEFRDGVQEIRRSPVSAPAVAAPPPALDPPVAAPSPPPRIDPAPSEASAPSVAAPPPAPSPRVVPEGEFEEAPLGTRTPEAPADSRKPDPPVESRVRETPVDAGVRETPVDARVDDTSLAPPPAAEGDVAAPPPGFGRRPASDAAAAEAPAPASTVPPAPPLAPEEIEERIGVLEAEIAQDQARLQDILSEPRAKDGPRIAEREDFRELALRLPRLQADLKALRSQRAGSSP